MKFDYHEPQSLSQVIGLLSQYDQEAALLAGGTALLIDIKHGERRPRHLISLWGVPGMAGVQANGGLHIGALTTISGLSEAIVDDRALRGVVEACWMLGSVQVQNVATVGGNICKASAGADMVPPLLCLDARLKLVGPDGERTTSLDGFLTGPDQTSIQRAEVLCSIDTSPLPPHTGTSFLKMMRRHAIDCSIVAVAASVHLTEGRRTCADARIAVGAAAPHPFRARRAENLLRGKRMEPDLVRAVACQAREESRPISDVRASADYRRKLVETLVERAVLKAAERASQGGECP